MHHRKVTVHNVCRFLRLIDYCDDDKISMQHDMHLDLMKWTDELAADIWPVDSLSDVPESMQIRSLCGPLVATVPHVERECMIDWLLRKQTLVHCDNAYR